MPAEPATTNTTAPPAWTVPSPLPESTSTKRLTLRFWTAADAQGMLDALSVDRSSYLPWLPWVAVDNQNVEQCIYKVEEWRRKRLKPDNDDFVIGIFDRATNMPVGGTGFHRIQPDFHEAEIGYWIDPRRRGTGLCTEAVAGLISWGFTPQRQGGWGFRRIIIKCAAANTASASVPRKLGLALEATLRKERFVPGHGWDDTLSFGVLRDEWKSPLA